MLIFIIKYEIKKIYMNVFKQSNHNDNLLYNLVPKNAEKSYILLNFKKEWKKYYFQT